ncbi:DEAD/DEAH box helicase [Paenibacillus sp. GSMTC-2017]|uniref:DNA repair helicase XPB n=1 Tax=Paenibacillus sp. GSMTC-2017 TaxID=2794350 RepID=UPI0018D88101|nr:DNA repair helicase XPB [Paenibacillus sp. GSMTC-2017]MBH5316779.1 DEAD/DEAH box helicase [Paenibacillus sp. GSMTC-2017]
MIQQNKAIIVQSDLTILLDERLPESQFVHPILKTFAETIKRTGAIHMYRITPISLWNALSMGYTCKKIVEQLKEYARYGVPMQVEAKLYAWSNRYGKLTLVTEGNKLILKGEREIFLQLSSHGSLNEWIGELRGEDEWEIKAEYRGLLKQELGRLGYPVIDLAGYHTGEVLSVELRDVTKKGQPFSLRQYQKQAVDHFVKDGSILGGSGVVVLPCGTGKTIVGIAALARLGSATLILTSSVTSAEQWREEILDKTTLTESDVALHNGKQKVVRPVTIATYQLLTHRRTKEMEYKHMGLFTERDWGLIIYDEVHLLPAPVFRMTASIQATRRLGLTATLVREDGCAEDVFSLIGPKNYDMEWKKAEEGAFISSVRCTEIRVALSTSQEQSYKEATARSKLRIASENPNKINVVRRLLSKHEGKPTLIIGQYLQQLYEVACQLNAPLLTGEVPQEERKRLYAQFKSGEIKVLVVSKVANLAVDLPDAAVAIQLSGSFGSRQEEAQRIGRLLRPKSGGNQAWFYTLVTDETKETEFALKRQLFMIEQGYSYDHFKANDLQEDRSLEDEEVVLR